MKIAPDAPAWACCLPEPGEAQANDLASRDVRRVAEWAALALRHLAHPELAPKQREHLERAAALVCATLEAVRARAWFEPSDGQQHIVVCDALDWYAGAFKDASNKDDAIELGDATKLGHEPRRRRRTAATIESNKDTAVELACADLGRLRPDATIDIATVRAALLAANTPPRTLDDRSKETAYQAVFRELGLTAVSLESVERAARRARAR